MPRRACRPSLDRVPCAPEPAGEVRHEAGPLNRSARSASAVSGKSAGPFADPDLSHGLARPLKALRIGVVPDAPSAAVEKPRGEAVMRAADVLIAEGHEIAAFESAASGSLLDRCWRIMDRILCAGLARWLDSLVPPVRDGEVEPLSQAVAARGRSLSAAALFDADQMAALISYEAWRLFDRVDVLLTPMLSGPPPPLGSFPLDHGDVDLQWRRMAGFAPYASLANVAGLPAPSIPHGQDEPGLPLPIQLLGPIGSDGLLRRLAGRLEAASSWSFAFPIAGLGA